MKADVYERVTARIIAELEKGVRPWFQPWSAENVGGRIARPLRANGTPYRGINIVMLWDAATEHGFKAPMWMTFKQALELGLGGTRATARLRRLIAQPSSKKQ